MHFSAYLYRQVHVTQGTTLELVKLAQSKQFSGGCPGSPLAVEASEPPVACVSKKTFPCAFAWRNLPKFSDLSVPDLW
jgi:hypothetical protein